MAGVLHEEIVAPIGGANLRNTEAAVVELKDGRLLLVWSDFTGGASDWVQAQISGKHSSDGGRTWSETFTVVPNAGQMNTYCPSLLRLRSGELGLSYFVKNSVSDNTVYWQRSRDEGRTWGEPVAVTPEPGYHLIINDRAVQLSSGRIVLPISWVPDYFDTASFRVFCAYSDDQGESWRHGATEIALPRRGAMEPLVVERRDGSLLMSIRTQLGDQYRAESSDGGDTWHDVRPLGVVGSEAPAGLKRIPSTGDLLLIWNNCFDPARRHFGRSPLTAAISRDEGETWENKRNLEVEPDRTFAYPSILFRGDPSLRSGQGEVLLTYWRSRTDPDGLELKLRILPVSWFYD